MDKNINLKLIFLLIFPFFPKNNINKMKMINNTPSKVSETLLKKYLSNHVSTQLNFLIYSFGFSVLKFGFAPAFDQSSYQLLIVFTCDFD